MKHKHINISSLQLDLEAEFVAKLKLITSYFESRMNGTTAHLMQSAAPADQKYRLNYGISLGDMKILAQNIKDDDKISLSASDFDSLWNTDIREAMLLALILIPENLILSERISRWISSIHTLEMAEMLPFLAAWRVSDPLPMLDIILSSASSAPAIQRIAYTYTLGRLIQHGKLERNNTNVLNAFSALQNLIAPESAAIAFLANQIEA